MANNNKKIDIGIGFKVDKTELNNLKTELGQLQNMSLGDLTKITGTQATIEDLNKIKNAAGAVQSALEKSFNARLNTQDLTKFNAELKNSGYTLQTLRSSFESAGIAGQNAFRNIAAELLNTNRKFKESSKWLDKMSETMANTVRWTVASSALNALTGSIQKAYSFTKSLDGALNDIRIVTGKSADQMADFAVEANKAAKSLGSTTKEYVKAALIYEQQGLGSADVAARTNVTTKVANVTKQSASEVSEQLTAIWNGYKVSAAEAELYIDKVSAVAATTAADLQELSEGMGKVASAANSMGVDIDQLNASLATIISVTRQDASSVGTALKTIYARMGDLAVDGEDEFGVKLGDVSGKLQTMGIQILDAQGQMREMGDVIEEVAAKWDTWTSAQQQAAAVALAGKRQYNNLIALFENWDMYESAKGTSAGSVGELQRQNDIYLESVEGHLKKLTTELEELYATLFGSDDIIAVVDALTKATNAAENFFEAIGGGKTTLVAVSSILLHVFGGKLSSGIALATRNLHGFFSSFSSESNYKHIVAELERTQGITAQTKEDIDQLVAMKQKQLQIEKFLNEENQKYANQLIKDNADLKNQLHTLEHTKETVEQIYRNISGQSMGENFEGAAAELQDKADYWERESKGYRDNYSDLDEVMRRNKQRTSNPNVQSEKNKNLQLQAQEEQLRILQSLQDEAHLGFDQMAADAQELAKNVSILSEKEIKRLEEIEELFLKLDQQSLEDIVGDPKQVENFVKAYKDLGKYTGKVANETQKAGDTAANYTTKLTQLKKKIDENTAANDRFVKSFRMEKIINSATGVVSAIGSITAAVQMLGNVKSIIENDDLTTGEKILQIVINLTSSIGMLVHGIGEIVSAVKVFRKVQQKTIVDTTAEAIATTVLNKVKDQEEKVSKDVNNAKQQENATRSQSIALIEAENQALIKNNLLKQKQQLPSGGQNNALPSGDKGLVQQPNTYEVTDFVDVSSVPDDKALTTPKKTGIQTSKVGLKTGGKTASMGGKTAALTSGKAAAAAGGKGVVAALGGMGAILGGVAIAAAGIIASVAIWTAHVNKANNALKKMEKASENMRKEMSRVTDAYSRLSSGIKSYEQSQKRLQDLAVGSEEWRDAVEESNAAVLELISQFPELAASMKTVNGVLVLEESVIKEAKNRAKQEAAAAAATVSLAESRVTAAQQRVLIDQGARDYVTSSGDKWATAGTAIGSGAVTGVAGAGALAGGLAIAAGSSAATGVGIPVAIVLGIGAALAAIGGTIAGVVADQQIQAENQRALNSVLQKYSADQLLDETNDAVMKEIAYELGMSVTELKKNNGELAELQAELEANTKALQAQQDAAAMQYYGSGAFADYNMSEFQTQLNRVMGEVIADTTGFIGKYNSMTDKEVHKLYAKALGLTYIKNKSGKGEFQQKNADGSYSTFTVDDATIREYLASQDALKAGEAQLSIWTNRLNQLKKTYSDASDELIQQIANIKVGIEIDYSLLSAEEIKWLQSHFKNDVKETDVNRELDRLDRIQNDSLKETLSSFIRDTLNTQEIRTWNDVLLGASSEQQQLIRDFFNNRDAQYAAIAGNINWSSNTAAVDYRKAIQEAGLATIDMAEIKEIASTLKLIAEADTLTMEALQERAKTQKSLFDNLFSQSDTLYKTIDEDQYNAIADNLKSYFVQMEDGTYALTVSAAQLKKIADDLKFDQLKSQFEAAVKGWNQLQDANLPNSDSLISTGLGEETFNKGFTISGVGRLSSNEIKSILGLGGSATLSDIEANWGQKDTFALVKQAAKRVNNMSTAEINALTGQEKAFAKWVKSINIDWNKISDKEINALIQTNLGDNDGLRDTWDWQSTTYTDQYGNTIPMQVWAPTNDPSSATVVLDNRLGRGAAYGESKISLQAITGLAAEGSGIIVRNADGTYSLAEHDTDAYKNSDLKQYLENLYNAGLVTEDEYNVLLGKLGSDTIIGKDTGESWLADVDKITGDRIDNIKTSVADQGLSMLVGATSSEELERVTALLDETAVKLGYSNFEELYKEVAEDDTLWEDVEDNKYVIAAAEAYQALTTRLNALTNAYQNLQKVREQAFSEDQLGMLANEIEWLNTAKNAVASYMRAQKTDSKSTYNSLLNTLTEYGLVVPEKLITDYASYQEFLNSIIGQMPNVKEEDQTDAWNAIGEFINTFGAILDKDWEELIFEANLNELELQLQLTVDTTEAQRKYNDFYRQIMTDEKDYSTLGQSYLSDYTSHLQNIEAIQANMGAAQADLAEKRITDAQFENLMKEYANQLQEEAISAQEVLNELQALEVEQIEKINENYEQQIEYLNKAVDLLDSYKALLELIYNEDSFALTSNLLTEQKDLLENSLALEQARYEWAMGEYNSNLTNADWDEEEKNAVLEALLSSGQSIVEFLGQIAQKEAEIYKNQVEKIIEDYQKTLLNGRTLQGLTNEWDWIEKNDARYLDTIDTFYALQSVENAFEKSINETFQGNIRAQQKLNEAKEAELDLLKSKDKLTQYDVERAKLRLSIAEAELALQDAQNTKTTMRLTRGADGGYTYQYVAAEDAIIKAEEELAKLKEELVNLDKDEWNSTMKSYYDTYTQWIDKMREYAADGVMTDEEKADLQRYVDYMNSLELDKNRIFDNLQGSVGSALEDFGLGLSEQTEQFNTAMAEITSNGLAAFVNNLQNTGLDTVAENILNPIIEAATTYYNTITDYQTQLNEHIKGKGEEDTGFLGLYKELQNALDGDLIDLTTELGQFRELSLVLEGVTTPVESLRESFEALTKEIDGSIQKAYELAGIDLVNFSLEEELAKQYETGYEQGLREGETKGYEDGYLVGWDEGREYGYKEGLKVNTTVVVEFENKNFGTNSNAVIAQPGIPNPIRPSGIASGATGMYTGEWGDEGKLAILHEKELVLNKTDTKNILDAVTLTRDLSGYIHALSASISSRLETLSSGIDAQLAHVAQEREEKITQEVNIQAEFPNATDKNQIKEAFTEILQEAEQMLYENTR